MSYPAYPPPRKPLPPARVAASQPLARRRNTGLLVAVLFVLFFGASAIGLSLFLPYFKAAKTSQIVAELFLRDFEKQNYSSALKRMHERGEEGYEIEDLRVLMTWVKKQRGEPVGHTGPERWKIENYDYDSSTSVRFVYREKYKNKGSAPVELHMVWQNDIERWRVLSADFTK